MTASECEHEWGDNGSGWHCRNCGVPHPKLGPTPLPSSPAAVTAQDREAVDREAAEAHLRSLDLNKLHDNRVFLVTSLMRHCRAEGERAGMPESLPQSAWSGLARQIVMWMDMYEGSNKTPRNLFLHLERGGFDIPQWLRDEPEMQALDHVPSKGTRVEIIYRAIRAAIRAAKP